MDVSSFYNPGLTPSNPDAATSMGPKLKLWAVVDLNVRDAADATSKKIGSVKKGTAVVLEKVPDVPWYYAEALKGFVALGDAKQEYWTAKEPAKPGKSSSKPAPKPVTPSPSPKPAPSAAAPGVKAEQPAGDNQMVLIIGGIAIAAMLVFMFSGSGK